MNDYLEKHLPELAEAERVAQRAVIEAAGEVSKAEAALRRAEAARSAARSDAVEAMCAHFAANNRPSGEAVPADLLARVAAAVKTPALEWDSVARTFREKAAKGAVGTVATTRRDGRVTLVVRLYLVEALPGHNPRWSRVAELEVWAHSGAVAGSGGRAGAHGGGGLPDVGRGVHRCPGSRGVGGRSGWQVVMPATQSRRHAVARSGASGCRSQGFACEGYTGRVGARGGVL